MKVAVTGGQGFVGSHIVRRLAEEEHEVVIIDDLSKGKIENTHGVDCKFVECDAAEFDYTGCEAIVHAAAFPDVSANWKHPDERTRQWFSNADLTRKVLDLAPDGCKFVFISTCSVYGPGKVNENKMLVSTSPYAASKIAGEALVGAYDHAGRIDSNILRLVNVVGARYGHGHLADFVRMAKTGNLHALDDGRKRKSFVHAGDVADAVLDAVEGFMPDKVTNITSEVCWSWRDSVAVMKAMRPGFIFDVTCENKPSGWIGDPDELKVFTNSDYYGKRSIVDGVREALVDLGW